MVKIIIALTLVMQVFGCVYGRFGFIYKVTDKLFNEVGPIALAEDPLPESVNSLKRSCFIISHLIESSVIKMLGSMLSGIASKLILNAHDNFKADKLGFCECLAKGEKEKAVLMTKEYNKHLEAADKLRLSVLTAIYDLYHKGTKASLPTLSCYLKQFNEKFVPIFPKKDGAQYHAQTIADYVIKALLIDVIEKETGKAAVNCPLPEATKNPGKLDSILTATIKAVERLQDK